MWEDVEEVCLERRSGDRDVFVAVKDRVRLWEGERVESSRWRAEEDEEPRDGGSPKMKNLIKAPMSMTTESWPRRKPWVKDKLWFGDVSRFRSRTTFTTHPDVVDEVGTSRQV